MNTQYSAFGDQRSAISKRRFAPRTAISLTEVLISMGVLTVGLLSVAALFPVGGYYMRKGEISDRGAAIAQAAFSDVVARGVLDPDNWLAADVFQRKFVRIRPRMKQRLRDDALTDERDVQNELDADQLQGRRADRQRYHSQQVGTAYVIDPWAVSTIVGSNVNSPTLLLDSSKFPTTWNFSYANADRDPAPRSQWGTWLQAWPIHRLTMPMPNTTASDYLPLSPELAAQFVRTGDDLTVDVSKGSDVPPVQRWGGLDSDGDEQIDVPFERDVQGDYSWIVSIAPTTPEARDGLATDPTSHTYVVSVVVFYKRNVGDADLMRQNERTVSAKVVTTGLTGGELLLERFPPAPDGLEPEESPFEVLREGQYVMVTGPHPSSTPVRPVFYMNWYRVVAVDDRDVDDPVTQRFVSLRGPQLPWTPANSRSVTNVSANDLRVGIFPGAVAVHSKTMRLEGDSVWSID